MSLVFGIKDTEYQAKVNGGEAEARHSKIRIVKSREKNPQFGTCFLHLSHICVYEWHSRPPFFPSPELGHVLGPLHSLVHDASQVKHAVAIVPANKLKKRNIIGYKCIFQCYIKCAKRIEFCQFPFAILGEISQNKRFWPGLTEFGPPLWQAEADAELKLSASPATAVGQILLNKAKFCYSAVISRSI